MHPELNRAVVVMVLTSGCAFVTFDDRNDADKALAALNDLVKLPGAKREMIVRYAGQKRPGDSGTPQAVAQEESEVKLYVGMLCRKSTEDDVKRMFEQYGPVKEVYLMRNKDATNSSKGCAFIKFTSREPATRAIQALNGVVTDGEAPTTLQVRFAHTKQEREGGSIAPQGGRYNGGGYNGGGGYGQAPPHHGGWGGHPRDHRGYGHPPPPPPPHHYRQPPPHHGGYGAPPPPSPYGSSPYGSDSPYSAHAPYGGSQYGSQPPYEQPPQPSYGHYGAPPPRSGSGPGPAGKDSKGPPGANLFIYNVPETYQGLFLSVARAALPFCLVR